MDNGDAMKKIYTILFLIFCFLPLLVNATELEIQSENMVLYNLTENKLLTSKNKDERVSIASMTKIMTTLVAIEKIENLDETIVLNYKVFEGLLAANASVAGFKVGQTVTYKDLLYGSLLPSGADATRALALSLVGSEEEFVNLMNQKAQKLNLKNTHFVNTSGLDEEGHYSTVDEVATMLKEALKNETFKEIFESDTYTTSDEKLTMYGTLRTTLRKYGLKADYIIGAKTGYTLDAGRCLASLAYDSDENIYYLLVTAKAPTTKGYYHLTDAINIYHYYFTNYGYQKLLKVGDELVTLKTKSAKKDTVIIHATEDVLKYLEKNYKREEVTMEYNGEEVVSAFTKVGTHLGNLTLFYHGEVLATVPIVLDAKIEFSLWVFIMENILIIITSIIVVVFTTHYIKERKKKRYKMKKLPKKRTLKRI